MRLAPRRHTATTRTWWRAGPPAGQARVGHVSAQVPSNGLAEPSPNWFCFSSYSRRTGLGTESPIQRCVRADQFPRETGLATCEPPHGVASEPAPSDGGFPLFYQLSSACCTPASTATWGSPTSLRESGPASCAAWPSSWASTTPAPYPSGDAPCPARLRGLRRSWAVRVAS